MALDGCMIAALRDELSRTLTGGRIAKISMPEKDELLLQIKNNGETYRLLISAGASLPLVYLTEENKPAPLQAAAFCMLLRKHLSSAVIISVTQSGLERVLCIECECYDELSDLCRKRLFIELMGKYSNIIFTDDNNIIIDSIKRIPASVSSLREVLPRHEYYLPDELRKTNPMETILPSGNPEREKYENDAEYLYKTYEGISPLMAEEICFRQKESLAEGTSGTIEDALRKLCEDIRNDRFSPVMILRKDLPFEFSAFPMHQYTGEEYQQVPYPSASRLLHDFYDSREERTRIRQKSADLRKIVTTALERAAKKLSLQEKQLRDCAGKDKYKVYGDLLNTYGYTLSGGEKSFTCENYYAEGAEITIPLDEHKSAQENAKKYFDKYQKLRRTEQALQEEIQNTRADVEHLSSILQAIEISRDEADLHQIRQELSEYGYVKKSVEDITKNKGGMKNFVPRKNTGGSQKKAAPLHFQSSDGFDIYVGKNNYQNEEVTFGIGASNDWWFHAKGVPGSHVLVKIPPELQTEEIPDRVFEEAAGLAAYYSKNNGNDKVEVDYTQRKNLKRTPGGAPGFVIYHTNYSMLAIPNLIEDRKI